jgi:putative photosynthetic complex assembly protein
MTMEHTVPEFGREPFPRAPLYGAAILVLAALAAVTFVRLTGEGASRVPDSPAVLTREFRFEDRPDGGINVIDAVANKQVEVITGTNGFLRGTLRGLARDRKLDGVGREAPFVLVARADGRLTLEDPTTGRHIDLESFGPSNVEVFAHLLTAGAPAS